MNRNVVVALFVIAIVAAVIVIIAVRHKKEGYDASPLRSSSVKPGAIKKPTESPYRKCICPGIQGGVGCACQNTEVVQDLYNSGQLTEFSKLRDKGWTTVSPGDPDWPKSQGCPDNGHQDGERKWVSWDFTDFGAV